MTLLAVVIIIIVIGVLVWLEETYIPMPPPFKTIIRIVVIVAICIWLLQLVGVLPDMNAIRLGK